MIGVMQKVMVTLTLLRWRLASVPPGEYSPVWADTLQGLCSLARPGGNPYLLLATVLNGTRIIVVNHCLYHELCVKQIFTAAG